MPTKIKVRQCQIDFLFSVLFILSNCHGNTFLWKKLSGKSLQIAISSIENIVHLAFKFVLKKNWLVDDFSQCIYLIVTMTFLKSKASSTMMFCNAISLKLVVGTYMGGVTLVYNGKKHPRSSPQTFLYLVSKYLLDSISEKSTICNLISNKYSSIIPKYWPAITNWH